MSLATLQLDDLTWSGMVEAVRSRIAANSKGQWTMHGPLDPGVTLLELFAYLFEQRLYWLDQLPEPLVRAMLALLDDAPLTTVCARTLLAFQGPETLEPRTVPACTLFQPQDKRLVLPMTTLEEVTVLPLLVTPDGCPRLDLVVEGRDCGPDLRAGRLVPVMPAHGGAAGFQIILWLQRPLEAAERDGAWTLTLDLDTPDAILPEWAVPPHQGRWFQRVTPTGYARVGEVPCAENPFDPIHDFVSAAWSQCRLEVEPPASLTWSYSTGAQTWAALGPDRLLDGTGGLRRSGVVRLRIPADWEPVATSACGAAGYALWVSTEKAAYSAPPRLRGLIPNVAHTCQMTPVEPPWTFLAPQLSQWLRLPGQQLQLPADQPEPLEEGIRLELREADGQWHAWRPTDHFYHHGPEDRVFVVERQARRLRFGNGFTGRIPVLEWGKDPCAQLSYLSGGGLQGNVGTLVWTSKATDLQPVNPVAGGGGAEAETLAEAKARVAGDLSLRERAVIAKDFEELALTTPGVAIARAHAAVGYNPDFPCHPVPGAVTLFLVPQVPREPALFESGQAVPDPLTDPGALEAVRHRLDTRRLLTSEVYVRSAGYRAVRLVVELQGVLTGRRELETRLTLSLVRYLDPLVGGERGLGWPFGEPLRPSGLMKQIRRQVEAGIAITRVAIALDGQTEFEDCKDVAIQPHELVYLQAVTFKLDRTPASQGGLR